MKKPDILIFMSDQHGYLYSGFGGHDIVQTPNLDAIGKSGSVFDSAYTSCPLCVPARVSMLTAQLPHRTGVFDNAGVIASDKATFMHSIAAQGYETVLCGRMHFMGKDQRHGFSKRIFDDITSLEWGANTVMKEELGNYDKTLGENGSTKVSGGGNSPVLEYDRQVFAAALDYLSQPHQKPQCILVGTYGPHFPYVAPEEYYQDYLAKVDLPTTRTSEHHYYKCTACKEQPVTDEKVKSIRAAYYGMVTHMDKQVGELHNKWKDYLATSGREGIFAYISDHGDQVGERNLYGKKNFFDGSAHIPLIFSGYGVPSGKRYSTAASIMDLGPTLCDMIGASQLPQQDGMSLLPVMQGSDCQSARIVVSEMINPIDGKNVACKMLCDGEWKYINYQGYEDANLLFNTKLDKMELVNVASENPDIVAKFKKILYTDWDENAIIEKYVDRAENHKLLAAFNSVHQPEQGERWSIPKEAVITPK